MTVRDFRDDFLTAIKVTAEAEQDSTVACFVKGAADILLENNIIPDYECAFFTGTGKRNKRLRVDGYALDDFDMTMYLLVADFDGGGTPNTLTLTQSKTILDRLQTFLEEVLSGNLLVAMEISRPSYDMAENILRNSQRIRKYSLILLTDRLASERLDNITSGTVQNTMVEYHVWDINRLFLLSQSDNESEVCINLSDYMQEPLACLEASSTSTDEYKSYLCALPAPTLADIYDHYGSRLLEGNVRSFLSTKRAVNKKIRETILRDPLRFFAYNNGISATATKVVKSRNGEGVFISEIKGLQIVNGGQTTASLSNARYRDNASLDNIFVQMKLTEVAPQIAAEIIPQISRSSNSQNKVSEADFFSNHPFHIRMEQLSRRILASSVDGAQYDTHWFYERANGQFLQAQSRMTKAEKKRFLMVNPQKQKVTKTDLAKAFNSWRLRPHKVSLGAQKNFTDFAQWITAQWDENSTQFNEFFFRKSMALIIMFRFASNAIKKQPWYENGYLANLITYSIAKFFLLIQHNFPEKELDLIRIWNDQVIPDEIAMQLTVVYKCIFGVLTADDRPVQNVTEWAKNKACWERIQHIDIQPISGIERYLLNKSDVKHQMRQAGREQKIVSGIEAQMFIVGKGSHYWGLLLDWGKERAVLSPDETKLLLLAQNMSSTKMPNQVHAAKLQELRDKLLSEGCPHK